MHLQQPQAQLCSMLGQLRPRAPWILSGACWQANGLEDHATAQELDWSQAPEGLPAADVVLCSDLVYEREVVPSLCEVLRRLCKPGTLLLMAMEIRPEIHAYALEQLAASGLSPHKVRLPEARSPAHLRRAQLSTSLQRPCLICACSSP